MNKKEKEAMSILLQVIQDMSYSLYDFMSFKVTDKLEEIKKLLELNK